MYPLGPLPWSLANTDGGLRTTDKAKLARHLEKRVAPPKAITEPSASVIDAMSILHKTTAKHHIFFVSKMLFNSILQTASQSDRIDVLFDTYCDESIKNPTRDARIRGEQVALNNITAGQKVQHWQDILETLASKRALITFFSDEWQGVYYMQKLSKGSKICGDGASQCAELMSSQEEADTRLILHTSYASQDHQTAIITTEDTDVFVLALGRHKHITANLYIQCGKQNCVRFIDIRKIASTLGHNTCNALIGMHYFKGCDTVSAFAGRGKISSLNMIIKEDHL